MSENTKNSANAQIANTQKVQKVVSRPFEPFECSSPGHICGKATEREAIGLRRERASIPKRRRSARGRHVDAARCGGSRFSSGFGTGNSSGRRSGSGSFTSGVHVGASSGGSSGSGFGGLVRRMAAISFARQRATSLDCSAGKACRCNPKFTEDEG